MREKYMHRFTDAELEEQNKLLESGVYTKTYTPTDEELERLNELYIELGIPQELDAMMKELRRRRNLSE